MDDLSNSENKQGGLERLPFTFRKKTLPDGLQEEHWKEVEAAIDRRTTPVRRLSPYRVWMTAAAALLLLVFATWYLYTQHTTHAQIAEIRTAYGEVKHILLPDSSVVILNANSSMRIPQTWSDGDPDARQVWLDGEAYFEVSKKTATRQKFVVHTRQVDVLVLGTKFNVNTRRQHAIVALEEGKIQLRVHGEGSSSSIDSGRTMVLRPGQVVVLGSSEPALVSTDKDVTTHSGWSRNEFHFDNTSLADIGRLIEDTYGYRIEAGDTSLLQRSISGDLRAENVEELVKVLEFTLKLNMRIDHRTIYVSNP